MALFDSSGNVMPEIASISRDVRPGITQSRKTALDTFSIQSRQFSGSRMEMTVFQGETMITLRLRSRTSRTLNTI